MSASQISERMDSSDQQFKYLQALWLVAAAASHRLPDIATWLILCKPSDATVSWYQSPSPVCVVCSERFGRNGCYLCYECCQEEQLWNKTAHLNLHEKKEVEIKLGLSGKACSAVTLLSPSCGYTEHRSSQGCSVLWFAPVLNWGTEWWMRKSVLLRIGSCWDCTTLKLL